MNLKETADHGVDFEGAGRKEVIRRRVQNGEKRAALAREYGISYARIYQLAPKTSL